MPLSSNEPIRSEAIGYCCLCGLYGVGCILPNTLWTVLIGPAVRYGQLEEENINCLPKLTCFERVFCPFEHAAAKNILCDGQKKDEVSAYTMVAPWFWVRFFCGVLKDSCDKKVALEEVIPSGHQSNPLSSSSVFEMREIQPQPALFSSHMR